MMKTLRDPLILWMMVAIQSLVRIRCQSGGSMGPSPSTDVSSDMGGKAVT